MKRCRENGGGDSLAPSKRSRSTIVFSPPRELDGGRWFQDPKALPYDHVQTALRMLWSWFGIGDDFVEHDLDHVAANYWAAPHNSPPVAAPVYERLRLEPGPAWVRQMFRPCLSNWSIV